MRSRYIKSLLAGAAVLLLVPSAEARRGPAKQSLTKQVMQQGLITSKAGQIAPTQAGVALQTQLASKAKVALKKGTFGSRNRYHAKSIGFESGLAAAKAAGVTDATTLRRVTKVFTSASLKSGLTFRRAFTKTGAKVGANEPVYKKAMNAAGPVASQALVRLAFALNKQGRLNKTKKQAIKREVKSMLNGARVEDLAAMVAKDLGLKVKVTGAEVVKNVQGLIPKDDWAYGDIAKMKVRAKGEKSLGKSQLALLNAGIRLANATWKAGQVHRAAWEGNDSRVSPSQRGGVYNPYDVLKVQMFNETYNAQLKKGGTKQAAQKVALSRVVFEVFKDLKQLTP